MRAAILSQVFARPASRPSVLVQSKHISKVFSLLSPSSQFSFLIFLSPNLYLCKCCGDNTIGGVYDSINGPTRESVERPQAAGSCCLFSRKHRGERRWINCTRAAPDLLFAKGENDPYFASIYKGWKWLLF